MTTLQHGTPLKLENGKRLRSTFIEQRLQVRSSSRILSTHDSRRPPISSDRTPPHEVEPSLAAILGALGDDTRLHIVRKLADCGEVACGQFDLDLPKSTMSHHFGVLISAGIIARRRDGTLQLNRLRREELDRSFPGLLDSVLRAR